MVIVLADIVAAGRMTGAIVTAMADVCICRGAAEVADAASASWDSTVSAGSEPGSANPPILAVLTCRPRALLSMGTIECRLVSLHVDDDAA